MEFLGLFNLNIWMLRGEVPYVENYAKNLSPVKLELFVSSPTFPAA